MEGRIRKKNKFYCFTCREVPYTTRQHWRSLRAHITPEQTVLDALKQMQFPVDENDLEKLNYCCSDCVAVMKSYTVHMKHIQRCGELWKRKTGRDPPFPLLPTKSMEDEYEVPMEPPKPEVMTEVQRMLPPGVSIETASPGVQSKIEPAQTVGLPHQEGIKIDSQIKAQGAGNTPAFLAKAGGVKRDSKETLKRAGLDHPYSMRDGNSPDSSDEQEEKKEKKDVPIIPHRPGVIRTGEKSTPTRTEPKGISKSTAKPTRPRPARAAITVKREREPRDSWKTRGYKYLEMSKYPHLYSGLWAKSKKARSTMITHMCRVVMKEMRAMEKTVAEETDLKTCTYFSWDYQLEKYRAFMPITCQLVNAILCGSRKQSRDQSKFESQRQVLMIALTLFHRKPGKFKLVQSTIALKLWRNGVSRKVISFLRGLGISQSRASAIRMQSRPGYESPEGAGDDDDDDDDDDEDDEDDDDDDEDDDDDDDSDSDSDSD